MPCILPTSLTNWLMQKAFSHKLLEVACFDAESCLIAERAGADRIEFCSDYSSGGLTPSWNDILSVKKRLQIPLHVIIRPREGDFVYSREDLQTMKRDILFCKEHKISGVVFGILTSDHGIDVPANKELLGLCEGLTCTFHRAIDACSDPEKALREIIALGFHKVLSSGGKSTALEGIDALTRLQKQFGEHITIMPGGGIRSHNVSLIAEETQCLEFHSAALTVDKNAVDPEEVRLLKEHILHV